MAWETEYRCFNCQRAMSFGAMMDSMGRCPKCGYKHKDAGTVVRCTEHAFRWVNVGKWYWPKWKKEYQENEA